MDNITILTQFAREISAAGETFSEHPEKLVDFERDPEDHDHNSRGHDVRSDGLQDGSDGKGA